MLPRISFADRYSEKVDVSFFRCDYLPTREIQREVYEELNVVENSNATNYYMCYGRPMRVSDE